MGKPVLASEAYLEMGCVTLKSDHVVVYDNVLSEGEFTQLFRHLNGIEYSMVHQRTWRKVWRLSDGQPLRGTAAWYYPPTSTVAQDESVYPTGSPMDSLIGWVVDHCVHLEHLLGRPGTEWRRLSFTPWVYPPGSGLSLHEDGASWNGIPYTGAYTFFAHKEWRLHWGGQLIVLDPKTSQTDFQGGELHPPFLTDDQETSRVFDPGHGIVVLPKPNRLVFLSPGAQHLMTRVDRNAGQNSRISIAGFFHKSERTSQPSVGGT